MWHYRVLSRQGWSISETQDVWGCQVSQKGGLCFVFPEKCLPSPAALGMSLFLNISPRPCYCKVRKVSCIPAGAINTARAYQHSCVTLVEIVENLELYKKQWLLLAVSFRESMGEVSVNPEVLF